MTSALLPLLTDADTSRILAWHHGRPVRAGQFLAQVNAFTNQLPPTRYLLNLCHNRYCFAVTFAAGLLSERISLQPSSLSADTLHQLRAAYPDMTVVYDDEAPPLPSIPRFHVGTMAMMDEDCSSVPSIPADRPAVVLFTSGSTGEQRSHQKSWHTLFHIGQKESHLLNPPTALIGTVPVQHSYGFEFTFLVPLTSRTSFYSGKPYFPQDIVQALAAVPSPRALVTTPYHLGVLLSAEVAVPEISFVLSAAAPLSRDLALQAESKLSAPVLEIYGSTETGAIASRFSTIEERWHLFDGVHLREDHGVTLVSSSYMPEDIPITDHVTLIGSEHFLLHGRHADQVNISGRRSSLSYLNEQIRKIPGVVDAAFYQPPQDKRLTAFVVAPGHTTQTILAALRPLVDPVFLPRPLILLDRLPRNEVSKLSRQDLENHYAQHHHE